MALKYPQQTGRAAFTLIELLVVIGIMAVLATVSVAGYSAVSRGMADRGAIQNTVSTLRVALQTCQIDRVPTKVLFFNQRLSDDATDDDAAYYQGTAIAIKQAGHITLPPIMSPPLLVDEFADWQQSYPTKGSDQAPGMRIFRMKDSDALLGIDGCSVLVQPFVTEYVLNDYMIESDKRFGAWCSGHGQPRNNYVWGFAQAKGFAGGAGFESWHKGDPYGIEIARFDLPRGYIFGKSAPTGNAKGLEAASDRAVAFDPSRFDPRMSGNVTVSVMRPTAGGKYKPVEVGVIDNTMLTKY